MPVSLEPSSAPDFSDAAKLKGVPHLFIWGDFLDKQLDLPSLGICGTSDAMMADDNSDAVAGIVLDWLRQRGLVVPADKDVKPPISLTN